MTLLKVVVLCFNKSWTPFKEAAVKVDMSCSNDSSKDIASFIRNVITRKKTVLQYSDNYIKEVETGDGTEICDFLEEPFSRGWGDFIIDNDMLNVVVYRSQITN